MGSPYIAEIRIFSFNFAPKGWAQCNGQLLAINQNQALFSLLGTTYGGNGTTTFALPDLRSRVPVHFNGSFTLGQRGGAETETLSLSETPMHTHSFSGTTASASTNLPVGNALATAVSNPYVHAPPSGTSMALTTSQAVGGGQPHTNVQPYLTLNICIALFGIFPSR